MPPHLSPPTIKMLASLLFLFLGLTAALSHAIPTSHPCSTNAECLRLGQPLRAPRRRQFNAMSRYDSIPDLQRFVVPATGPCDFIISGGAGGDAPAYGRLGGLAAQVNVSILLPQGTAIDMYVGEQGHAGTSNPGGGGGATWVLIDDQLFVVAGAGGGAADQPGLDADPSFAGDGSNGQGASGGAGSTMGSGGTGGQAQYYNGGGGGGYTSNGGVGHSLASGGGGSSFNNGLGGARAIGREYGGGGGYGGGGAAGVSGAGGGGGYSGGGGGSGLASSEGSAGGSGGSFADVKALPSTSSVLVNPSISLQGGGGDGSVLLSCTPYSI